MLRAFPSKISSKYYGIVGTSNKNFLNTKHFLLANIGIKTENIIRKYNNFKIQEKPKEKTTQSNHGRIQDEAKEAIALKEYEVRQL